MGLDFHEFVMDVEETFQFRFPDESMTDFTTPRRLIDYLSARLPTAAEHFCPSQRVFYRLRSAVAARLGCPRSALRPDTSLLALIPGNVRAKTWEGVRRDCGASRMAHWPRLDDPDWLDFLRPRRIGTLREATKSIVARLPGAAKVVKGHEAGWTRSQVAEAVHTLIVKNFGIERQDYTEDSRWDKDMGVW
jgi:hypothetical protein